jgi:hypothetical protein
MNWEDLKPGDATYEVNVTPVGFEGLTPVYEVMLYRYVKAGICGPFSETVRVVGLANVRNAIIDMGYAPVEEFGPVCANGFASAKVVPLGHGIDVA